MSESIGILGLDQLVYQREGQGCLQGIRQLLPPEVEVLDEQTTALELLDFIENHKRLIIIGEDSSNYGRQTAFGEVAYWGHLTGGITSDIVVLGKETIQESIEPILSCLERWNKLEC